MEIEMRKFVLTGLATLLMLMFAALAQAEGPVFTVNGGLCGVFDADGWIWQVSGLHITSSTDPDGNTNLHCNAKLPEGAAAASGKPVAWDAFSCGDLPIGTPPEGAFAAQCAMDGLIYCGVGGRLTSDWHDVVNSGGRSNASCTIHGMEQEALATQDTSAWWGDGASPTSTPTPTPTPTAAPICQERMGSCTSDVDCCAGECFKKKCRDW
jgi:hypothetical protein